MSLDTSKKLSNRFLSFSFSFLFLKSVLAFDYVGSYSIEFVKSSFVEQLSSVSAGVRCGGKSFRQHSKVNLIKKALIGSFRCVASP